MRSLRTPSSALCRALALALASAPLVLGLIGGGCGSSSDDEAKAEAQGPEAMPEKDWAAESERLLTGVDWYRHAVFYEVFVRSFQDSNGDGKGDLQGLISRLDYLKGLGVDAIWLMPIMPSPFKDSGYDIADYTAINPDYGTMADFEQLVAEAHKRKMRVMIDLVLNHTSDQHPWFQASRSSKQDPKADWYVWSDTPSPPDNPCTTQQPLFGDSAWQYDEGRKQYYFHRFYAAQPDLNYRNPEVAQAQLDMMKLWLDKGVDGFRCDVIALLFESAKGCDLIDETRDYIKKMRALLDQYPGAVMVAESTDFKEASAYFGSGKDMFHMAFNFAFGYFWQIPFGGATSKPIALAFQNVIDKYPEGSQDALVIGSHDVARAYSVAQGKEWRHRRAFDIEMTMRGTPFVYYGEELGLRPGSQKIVDMRDAQRTPMPWTKGDGHGFTTGSPWLAFGAEADQTSVEAEQQDPSSMLAYYKGLLALRRGHEVWGTGTARILPTDNEKVFFFAREGKDEAYAVAINMSDEPQSASSEQASLPGKGKRVWGEGELTVEGARAKIDLPAEQGAVFRVRLARRSSPGALAGKGAVIRSRLTMSAPDESRPGVRLVHVPVMSNQAFFDQYAAPGRVGLVGGESLLEKAIRRAQRRQTDTGRWSHWGHAFVCQGRRADGRHWVLESDLDMHRERTMLGVQENPVDKYHDDGAYPYLALLDFGITDAQSQSMIGVGLRLLTDRTQYSLREIAALYVGLKAPHKRQGENPLSRGEKAMFCSAFVQHLYLGLGLDFAPEVATKLTTPEDIACTGLPHTAYLLLREPPEKTPAVKKKRAAPAEG